MTLPDGLYDLLLTEGIARSLSALSPGSAEVLSLKAGASETGPGTVAMSARSSPCATSGVVRGPFRVRETLL